MSVENVFEICRNSVEECDVAGHHSVGLRGTSLSLSWCAALKISAANFQRCKRREILAGNIPGKIPLDFFRGDPM